MKVQENLAVLAVVAVLHGGMEGFAGEVSPERVLERHAARTTELVEVFCAESKLLAADPFFAASPRKRDAGPYLNPRFAWEKEIASPNSRESLTLPAPLRADLDKMQVGEISDDLVRGLPTGWMGQLLKFDHWSLISGRPPAVDALTFPRERAPDLSSVAAWAKARLTQGALKKDEVQAAEEVRYLARLLRTNTSLVPSLLASTIGNSEKALADLKVGAGTGLQK